MQLMPPLTTRAVVFALVGGSFAVFANIISFVMIGKINERVPEKERLSYVWWSTEVRKRFKKLYPANKLVALLDFCLASMVLSFLLLIRFWVFR